MTTDIRRDQYHTVIVAGGAGFIGANFVRNVVSTTNWSVVVVDKLTYAGNLANLESLPVERVDVVVGDICDENLVNSVASSADAIVNFAAESHNDRSLHAAKSFLKTNVEGTFVLLEAARRFSIRYHHVSTDEVYGDLPIDTDEAFTLDSPYRPSSPYSATKAASDHLVTAWTRSYGVQATISNCANNYGPYQHVEKFIPRQITNLLIGTRPKLYGAGSNVREWLHVNDHVSGIMRVLEFGRIGSSYLLSSGIGVSNIEVLRLVLELMDHPSDFFDHVRDRPGHDRRYALDSASTRSDLGWSPTYTDLREGLCDTIRWYSENTNWWAAGKRGVEEQYRRFEG
ncbi:dTDP-glucose 4,6-dehydratase [Brevibacterium aurantiacum]|uniref:dTDP-glucose 4,6-dehydratase n=1 Tax=Brevibacterium aurantiacum TaxID=273384 RepID=A0A556C9H0_BREAU|nr:dTDP-glucose 4,6-dehydratase [Brevibacterium aurantiacum]TSI14093.1 dTDP-glucose 4,6-dehydratase [Brevibacterium aurantiacum]